MKKLFFISLSTALLWVGSTATFAQVDRSDPEALIKTATQQVLNQARQGTIREGDTQSVVSLMDRDVLPYVDFRRTTQLATGRSWRSASANQRQFAETINQSGVDGLIRFLSERNQQLASGKPTR